jgi:hypothetical protein
VALRRARENLLGYWPGSFPGGEPGKQLLAATTDPGPLLGSCCVRRNCNRTGCMLVDLAVRSVCRSWRTSSGPPAETDREEDVNPLICIGGSASPGHSYPMTPLNVMNTGNSPVEVTYSANPAVAMTWLKASPVEVPPGGSASIPLTLVVPANAGSGENYVILTAGGAQFDVKFSVSVPPPAECVAAGYKPPQGTSSSAFSWLIVLVLIIVVIFWVRSRLGSR